MSILPLILAFFLLVGGLPDSASLAAGPFHYRLPQGPGVDQGAVTVVGEPQSHHTVRYQNMYDIARKYDLGFWELARYHRGLDHFYLPWDTDIDIPTRWILPEDPTPPGYILNVAELRGYRFFPDIREVCTYPVSIGVSDYKSPIGKCFRVQSKAANPGWRIPASLRWKYDGKSFLPPGEDNPVGSHWLGLSNYGLHGTHAPMGVGRQLLKALLAGAPLKKLQRIFPKARSQKLLSQPLAGLSAYLFFVQEAPFL